ncbi:MAG: VWA domain-containing protein [Acidobacteria bacterium]|nr:VWA domain-containing protein [Acidobacteriota bacterium]
MLEIEYKWVFLLVPLPLISYWLLRAFRERREAIRGPFFDEIAAVAGLQPERGAMVPKSNWGQKILGPVVWVLLVAAAARPVWVEDPIRKTLSTRDLLLAVDLSQSMEARDFTSPTGEHISRVDAVRLVLNDFIAKRKGDRIGLVFFGTEAYPQAPFTLDHQTCKDLLAEARPGMPGPQTMIGDAIGLGIRMFEKSQAKRKVMILLTDGNDSGSKVPPTRAASLAKDFGVVTYAVAVGDPGTVGENKLDEATLRKIASITNGKFYRAQDQKQLAGIYDELNQIEKVDLNVQTYRPKRPLFQYPLGAAMGATMAYHLMMLVAAMLRRLHRSAPLATAEPGREVG